MSDATNATLPAPAEASLLLDFDGTLIDIAPTPDGIDIPADFPDLLAALDTALEGRLALVSGRAVASIEQHLPTFKGVIVGGHGAEIRRWDGLIEQLTGSDADIPALHSWAQAVEDDLSGTLAELKQTGVAMHFRQAPHHEDDLREAAQAHVQQHPELALQEAHMTVELRPKNANKASAVEALMQSDPFKGHLPIFAGDDQTDIPAMAYCRTVGGCAISLNGIYPDADIHLATPADLRRLLSDWIR